MVRSRAAVAGRPLFIIYPPRADKKEGAARAVEDEMEKQQKKESR